VVRYAPAKTLQKQGLQADRVRAAAVFSLYFQPKTRDGIVSADLPD
jgi:hypothetical protein